MKIDEIIEAIHATRVNITLHARKEAENDLLVLDKIAVLITVYRPDPSRWINWKERRNR